MDKFTRNMIIGIVAFLTLALYCGYRIQQRQERYAEACEAKGGVALIYTPYRQSSVMTCVAKGSIIKI